MLNNRIKAVIEDYGLLSDAQFGFRPQRSTVDAIFVLHSLVNKIINKNERLYCAFIDLKSAFDKVNRNGLWSKLYNLGIKGKFLRVIKNMYTSVKSCVRNCNNYSEYFECAVGLRQGEVMSPIMFPMFINDLEIFLCNDINSGLTLNDVIFILLLFADDMVVLGKSVNDLQQSLDLLKQ